MLTGPDVFWISNDLKKIIHNLEKMDIKNDEHAMFSRKFSSDMTKVDKGFICSPTIKLNQNSIIAIMRYISIVQTC